MVRANLDDVIQRFTDFERQLQGEEITPLGWRGAMPGGPPGIAT